MVWVGIAYGSILILLGLGGWFGSGRASLTALIPCGFGLPVVVLAGLAATQTEQAQGFMIVVLVITALGFLGNIRGLIKLKTMLSGGTVDRPQAVIAQSVMGILSLVILIILGTGVGTFARV
ncbi:MAG: hypothetical protein IIC50_22695 [Planctomycetes bacterium]|nr:hypothetical protein [Planctomycetota bacterium]